MNGEVEMVICEEHKYLFIEIPLTASWAIYHELCNDYGGVPILHKHASYPEFVDFIGEQAKDYYVFACVRNPLDEIVSRYYKLFSDHKGVFSDPVASDQLITEYVDQIKYELVKKSDMGFVDYFRKFHRRPFGGLVDICSDRFNFVIRFEDLQSGFSEVLDQLNIKQVRPLPFTNKTQGRSVDWQDYYPLEIQKLAMRVCGPFMLKWGYEFPLDWGKPSMSRWHYGEYKIYSLLREIYMTEFRYKDTPVSRIVRKLRAKFQ